MPSFTRLLATTVLTGRLSLRRRSLRPTCRGTYKVTGEIANNDLDATLVLKQDGECGRRHDRGFHGRARASARQRHRQGSRDHDAVRSSGRGGAPTPTTLDLARLAMDGVVKGTV